MSKLSEKEIKDTIIILEDTDISTIDNAENVDLRTYQLAVKNLLNLYNKEKDYAMGLYYDVQGLQQDLDKEKEKNKNSISKDKINRKIEELKDNCYAESIEFNDELIEILQELLEEGE